MLVPSLGRIRFKASRILEGQVKMGTMIRCGHKRTARIVVDIGRAAEKRVVTTAIGMDVGLTTLATLSDGIEIENPRWTRAHEDRIAAANRLLARKKRRSNNRVKARETLHRAHQRPRMLGRITCITCLNGLWACTISSPMKL